jgi:hypothetical protein
VRQLCEMGAVVRDGGVTLYPDIAGAVDAYKAA